MFFSKYNGSLCILFSRMEQLIQYLNINVYRHEIYSIKRMKCSIFFFNQIIFIQNQNKLFTPNGIKKPELNIYVRYISLNKEQDRNNRFCMM